MRVPFGCVCRNVGTPLRARNPTVRLCGRAVTPPPPPRPPLSPLPLRALPKRALSIRRTTLKYRSLNECTFRVPRFAGDTRHYNPNKFNRLSRTIGRTDEAKRLAGKRHFIYHARPSFEDRTESKRTDRAHAGSFVALSSRSDVADEAPPMISLLQFRRSLKSRLSSSLPELRSSLMRYRGLKCK